MKPILFAVAAAAAAMAALDLLWLGVLAKDLYRGAVGPLMADHPRWWAAALFYLLYAGGIVHFVVRPALAAGSFSRAAGQGAVLGLLVYGVYDLTNLALLRGWPVWLSAVDVAWGCFATGAAACFAFLVASS